MNWRNLCLISVILCSIILPMTSINSSAEIIVESTDATESIPSPQVNHNISAITINACEPVTCVLNNSISNYQEINGTPVALNATFSGITLMGIMSFPAGPGKIKIGTGLVGSSLGFTMESSYGIRIGSLSVRAGIRSTEALSAKTAGGIDMGRSGWMDGQIVLGINL